jgi:3'-phosphoadenosine 5'-phosphosulfate sulfotransferase (PAPS reductase)/FAD synthetase
MQNNPFKIEAPAVISFSGGRTSGYMLYKILEAHQFKLPKDIYVTFANTGKECEETLEFVNDCEKHWGVKIHWLEHYFANEKPKHRTRIVTFKTASRKGEPFERLIDDRQMLPNPVARYCSSELKIKVISRFMKSKGFKTWSAALGLRYDEPRRSVNARNQTYEKWDNIVPLYDAKKTIEDVDAFWDKQDFNLKLKSYNGKTLAGNCDMCFLKSTQTLVQLAKEKPEMINWWIEQESKKGSHAGAKFKKGRDYIQILDLSKQTDIFASLDDAQETCFCHD